MDPPTPSERFPKKLRLTRKRDFDRVFQARSKASDSILVLHGAANALPHSRLGISAGRRLGNAVVRNRWKRLIREAFRKQRLQLPSGFDFVARPQLGAEASALVVARSLLALARKLQRRESRS